jgi:hypothetical protein
LTDYFAICDTFVCFSAEAVLNTPPTNDPNTLPLSTTITMAVLLPVSCILFFAFYVAIYKLCCEGMSKM